MINIIIIIIVSQTTWSQAREHIEEGPILITNTDHPSLSYPACIHFTSSENLRVNGEKGMRLSLTPRAFRSDINIQVHEKSVSRTLIIMQVGVNINIITNII